jgi:DNA-binding transcriptional ArsR family regulator
MPRRCNGHTDLAQELDRIAELPLEVLLEDIAFACGSSPSGPWGVVARQPQRWLPRYATALRKAWSGVRGLWADAAGVFDREVRRVGVACANGATAELLADIHPRAHIADGKWMLADPELRTLRVPERGLTLIPILGGYHSAGAALHEDGTLDWIVHPLAEATTIGGQTPPPAARLEALLGPQRASVLRALDNPRSVGRLATTLMAVPSAATHHVGALEAAGLVERERQGRSVIVHRTARGTQLMGLYDES